MTFNKFTIQVAGSCRLNNELDSSAHINHYLICIKVLIIQAADCTHFDNITTCAMKRESCDNACVPNTHNRLNEYFDRMNMLGEEQAGFNKRFSTLTHIFVFKDLIYIKR